MKLRAIAVLAGLPMLGGCMQTFQSSVAGSCGVFERPPYAVLGKTRYDQDVADKFVESGVAGCNWKRPAVRPASLDVPAKGRAIAPAPVKRKSIMKRIRDRVLPPKVEAPAAAVPPPAPVVVAPEPATPPPAPRRPIDELLRPQR